MSMAVGHFVPLNNQHWTLPFLYSSCIYFISLTFLKTFPNVIFNNLVEWLFLMLPMYYGLFSILFYSNPYLFIFILPSYCASINVVKSRISASDLLWSWSRNCQNFSSWYWSRVIDYKFLVTFHLRVRTRAMKLLKDLSAILTDTCH